MPDTTLETLDQKARATLQGFLDNEPSGVAKARTALAVVIAITLLQIVAEAATRRGQ